MFEFVSFRNRIVLNYNDEKIILIKVRNNKTGEYFNLEEFVKNSGFDIGAFESVTELFEYIVKQPEVWAVTSVVEITKKEYDELEFHIVFFNWTSNNSALYTFTKKEVDKSKAYVFHLL